jgi:hypothetical protein
MRTRIDTPRDSPLHPDRVWGFFQYQEGTVFLEVIGNQGQLVPAIAFVTPAALMDFQEDLDTAVERFVPLAVRQAEEVVRKGWDVDAGSEDSRPGPSDRPVEPTQNPSGEIPTL